MQERKRVVIANAIPWPDGARCAVGMTWNMDADSAFNWYSKETADNLVAAQSWTRYDPLIAIPRLVAQFARRELRLNFFVPAGSSRNTRRRSTCC